MRSAIYQAASAEDRRAAHRLLADALQEPRYRDRRALHLAEAATGPDEHVASELEWAAARFAERSGCEAELVVLERAADLSADEHAGRRRRIAGGGGGVARRVARPGAPGAGAGGRRGRRSGCGRSNGQAARAVAELRDGDPRMPCAELEAAAGSIAGEDPELAAELLIDAAGGSDGDRAVALAARARGLAPEGGEAELRACVALATVLRDSGRDVEAADPSERAAAILDANPQAAHDPDVLLAVAESASDPAVAAHLVERAVAAARGGAVR